MVENYRETGARQYGKITFTMKTAHYSLITMRPNPERLDTLCVGVAILAESEWIIRVLPTSEKLLAVDRAYPITKLQNTAEGLRRFFSNCKNLYDARQMLFSNKSAVSVHEFEGVFVYETDEQFAVQVNAIMCESVLPIAAPLAALSNNKKEKTRIRTKLRKRFEDAGIFSRETDGINDHKVVANYPVSLEQGLNAEFALKNSVMHLTETLDFGVSDDLMRNKNWEAQAKCLTLRVALEKFGKDTQRHIILAGSSIEHAARSVNLLSTAGTLYMLESSTDMANYFDKIESAAQSATKSFSRQLM